jgi:hypothetical protein
MIDAGACPIGGPLALSNAVVSGAVPTIGAPSAVSYLQVTPGNVPPVLESQLSIVKAARVSDRQTAADHQVK